MVIILMKIKPTNKELRKAKRILKKMKFRNAQCRYLLKIMKLAAKNLPDNDSDYSMIDRFKVRIFYAASILWEETNSKFHKLNAKFQECKATW